jgi:oxygen-independent coproporphyrinogen-3 oxidase
MVDLACGHAANVAGRPSYPLRVSELSVGVYVHVPFCDRVCPYCDFAVVGGGVSRELEVRYVDALLLELTLRAEAFGGRRLASLYLGGGTPSLLGPDSVARIIDAVSTRFEQGSREPEVTIEVNPSTTERSRLPAFRDAGVNRVSLGIQSFDDRVLKRLGRAHLGDEGRRSLAAAREAGFDNVSLDLMIAAPGQTLEMLDADLAEAAAFGPEHASVYELVVESGTPFALADSRGQLARADSDMGADMVEHVDAALASVGLDRYEITNYAIRGRESVHNQRYWAREPVLGLGVGAWSSEPARHEAPHGSRSQNCRVLGEYLEHLGRRELAIAATEMHDEATARGEAIFLALRCREGLSAQGFREVFGAGPRDFYTDVIDRLAADGLLTESQAGDLRLTERGRMLSDLVSEHFV